MLDAGRHRLEACRLDPANHLVRLRRGGDVNIAVRLPKDGVTHRAADHTRLLAGSLERGEEVAQRRLSQPGNVEASRQFVLPGTNWPSSMWAGT